MSPCRPSILKVHDNSSSSSSFSSTSSTSSSTRHHQRVHFPPSPTLSRVYPTHSTNTYDRSSIIVTPNACAIPERGCPGQTYYQQHQSLHHPPSSSQSRSGRSVHPRAFAAASSTAAGDSRQPSVAYPNPHNPPVLMADISSESDSDGLISPPPEPLFIPIPYAVAPSDPYYHPTSPLPAHHSHASYQNALTFLPHPPPPDVHSNRERRRKRDRHYGDVPSSYYTGGADGHFRSFEDCHSLSTPSTSKDLGCLGGF